jgi:hypothetical protein
MLLPPGLMEPIGVTDASALISLGQRLGRMAGSRNQTVRLVGGQPQLESLPNAGSRQGRDGQQGDRAAAEARASLTPGL